MMATYNEMIAENANTIKTNQEINHSNMDAMKVAIDALIQIVSHIDASLHNLEGTVAININTGSLGMQTNNVGAATSGDNQSADDMKQNVNDLFYSVSCIDQRVGSVETRIANIESLLTKTTDSRKRKQHDVAAKSA
ncbi:predicted protein [Thalassiosira pseudonana CCMP1335]|uniref:Uncharacterized protein n=1 Tax=Thalassiosira pseudonana TaxID=35128 RepID=B8LC12_THAPS|nr:predicted protein [Thalassiosira pseudonana CCMP1335]EED87138.1 predicted protein [Thalassiosira pseudonana CCMP1335]